MSEEIVFTIKTDTSGSEKTIGELRSEFRELNNTINNTKVGTDEYNAALIRLGNVKGELQDVRQNIIALNPEKQIAAISRVGTTVASGFAAAQGAAALFGSQSEDLTKVLVRVQAATALASGLQGLSGMGKALQTARLAMIAFAASNPFTAIALAITGVIALFSSLRKETEKDKTELDKLNESHQKYVDIIKESNRLIDNRITSLKGLKDSESDILKLEKEKIINNLNLAKSEFAVQEAIVLRFKTEANVLQTASTVNVALAQDRVKSMEVLESGLKSFRDNIEKVEADLKQANNKITGVQEKSNEEYKKLLDELKPDIGSGDPDKDPLLIIPQKQAEMNESLIENQTNFQQIGVKSSKEFWAEQIKQADEFVKYRQALVTAELELESAKWSGLITLANIGQQLSGKNRALADTLFVVEKALAIGQIVVSTQKEIAGYYSNPTWKLLPDGGLALATAASAAAKIRAGIGIATIAATSISKFIGGGGGASISGGEVGTIPSPGGGSAPVIEPPSLTATQTQTTAEGEFTGFAGRREQPPIRAYVVETEISESQKRVRGIEDRARF